MLLVDASDGKYSFPQLSSIANIIQTYKTNRGYQATRQEVFQDLDTLHHLSFLFLWYLLR
jgi:hypothetical protein